jgi:hypothetical protein
MTCSLENLSFTALQNGDPAQLNVIAKVGGYAKDLEEAINMTLAGPEFDIRAVASFYTFIQPPNLESKHMVIEPFTDRFRMAC